MKQMKRVGFLVCIAMIAAFVASGCNPFGSDSESGTTAILTHFGYDFSKGMAGTMMSEVDSSDGEVINWQPGGATHASYPAQGEYVWWRNDQVTTGTANETRDMGEVSLSSVTEAPSTWEETPDIMPLLVGHVYVAKCRDGYVKFEVLSTSTENNVWEATVKYVHSASASF